MLEKFEQFISELKENPLVNVREESTADNRELLEYRNIKKYFEKVFEKTKIHVPQEDWKYEDLGALSLDWDATTNEPDEHYLWGGFQLHNFSAALSTRSNFWKRYNDSPRFWKNNPQPEAEAIWETFLPKLNYINGSGHGSDGTFGCILREEGIYPCSVYFFDSGIWFEMDMNLETYYNTMIDCKAVYYWQYFYIETEEIVKKLGSFKPVFIEYDEKYLEGPHPFADKFRDGTFTYSAEGILHQMKNIIKRFPTLFPDFDLTYFKEKCDALEKTLKQ
ncbi:hypothetical protein [Chryseobacterium koreense]|uniref:hypothetical protein n=1 Tax=Chryseobacterium koreense TaxID=232216 RepID=UPI00161FEBBC|nr:hypothetical protein [Chryseobacterium koreense]MBB5332609.1 hypothetical protein [Chryseobacterium koreense]